jgi:hypothetical protein
MMGTAYVLTLVASTLAAPPVLKLPRVVATAARRRAPRAAPLGLPLVVFDETGRPKRDAGRPGKEAVVSSLYEGEVPKTTGPGADELPEDCPRRPPARPPTRTIKAAAATRAHLREDQEEKQQQRPPFSSSSPSSTSLFVDRGVFACTAMVVVVAAVSRRGARADALRGFITRKEVVESEEGWADRGAGKGAVGSPAPSTPPGVSSPSSAEDERAPPSFMRLPGWATTLTREDEEEEEETDPPPTASGENAVRDEDGEGEDTPAPRTSLSSSGEMLTDAILLSWVGVCVRA